MAQSHSKPVELIIRGPDEATEIFLIDASLQRIAAGVGRLTADVPPGLYKVRYRSGVTQHDTLISVPDDVTRHVIEAAPVQFRAAAPINDTRTTHEYQSEPAVMQSRQTHLSLGQGSHVFLFAREASDEEAWHGCNIALHDLKGERLTGVEAGFTDVSARVAGLNVELNPGTYAVRVSDDTIGSYEMYVTASAGWQTQLFFSFDSFWSRGERVRAPSIRQASLLMAHSGVGFHPGSDHVRTAELARQALTQGRDVVSKDVMNRLLGGKFEDPMLGIIGAHLLLRRPKRDVDLLSIVCGNLRSMLGEHPDVQALELALGRSASQEVKAFAAPPSFRHGWEEIVRATRRRASLVPSEGPVAQIAANVVRAGPWLTRRVPAVEKPADAAVASLADAVRLAGQLLAQDAETLTEFAKTARAQGSPLSSIEQAVLTAALSSATSRGMIETKTRGAPVTSETDKKSFLSNISAPTYAVASAIAGLASRLNLKT